jgi:hypothetical protein
MDWINPAQDEDQWWALVNMVMNFCVLQNGGKLSEWWLLKKDSVPSN